MIRSTDANLDEDRVCNHYGYEGLQKGGCLNGPHLPRDGRLKSLKCLAIDTLSNEL